MKASTVSETARRYQNDASDELQALLSSSEEFLESLADQSGDAVEELRGKLKASIERTKQRLGDSAASIASTAQDASEAAQSYVERNPWTAIAIGSFAGLLVGALLASRGDFLNRFRAS